MIHFKTSFSALLLASAAVSAPATAQVAGIATLDSTDAIMQSKAFSTGYQQVGTSYAAYAQQINAKRKEINDINAQLDTNKDKNLTQAELDAAIKAKSPLIAQLETKEKEVAGLQDPIVKAQAFVVESVADKYLQAQQQVVTQKKISMILSPDAFIWAPDSVDITAAVTAALDQIVPSVTITPPANCMSRSRSVSWLPLARKPCAMPRHSPAWCHCQRPQRLNQELRLRNRHRNPTAGNQRCLGQTTPIMM
jgi:Skp family chaperone for outer membrane proteins